MKSSQGRSTAGPQSLEDYFQKAVWGTRTKNSEFGFWGTRTKNALSSHIKIGIFVRNYLRYFLRY